MSAITPEFAQTFARHWLDAWNAHDLEQILAHYHDDFQMSSPFIASVSGEPSGTLKGKQKVRAYWQKALEKMPDLHFELIEVLIGGTSLCLYYHSVNKLRAAEWFEFGGDGKVIRAVAHYSQPAKLSS